MCQFFSCVVTQKGDVLYDLSSISHETIIENNKLKDSEFKREKLEFARVEILPPDGNVFEKDLSKWSLTIDENIKPIWWKKKNEKDCFEILKEIYDKVVIQEVEIEKLSDNYFYFVKNAQIKSVSGNAQIKSVSGNTQIKFVSGNAQITSVFGNTQIEFVYGNAQIEFVYGNTQIKFVFGNAQIKSVFGNAQIKSVFGNTQIEFVYGNAQIKFVSGNAQIKSVFGNAQIEFVFDNNIIKSI